MHGTMAVVIGDEFDAEIRATFSRDNMETDIQEEDDIKPLFKDYKKLVIRSLNRKWDILSPESYISNKIIPRGLREKVVPATHL